ncbi:MAG: uracil-DNA glycosylase, partial [Planctomycetaceae bacterium]|nr:uracil-DNA glycosylase [Planctomycetaceae bacterium]
MAKHTLKQGLIDYLETLQMAGVSEISTEHRAQSAECKTQSAECKDPEVECIATSGYATNQNLDVTNQNRDDQLKQIADVVCKCKKCPELVANRTQTVFGVGNPFAELVFLGEAPGADEDKQGIPFVGRAGKLLTDMIEKGMRLKRDDVYICNILRCRPPGNRNPDPVEAAHCRPFLDATLEVIQPKYLCCLGSIAATNLLDSQETIG